MGQLILSQVTDAITWITSKAENPVTIVMKSTVPPGTGMGIINQYLDGLSINHAYVMNPEFLREGQAVQDWFNPDRTVIGTVIRKQFNRYVIYIKISRPRY